MQTSLAAESNHFGCDTAVAKHRDMGLHFLHRQRPLANFDHFPELPISSIGTIMRAAYNAWRSWEALGNS
jgi:hypothetical protein